MKDAKRMVEIITIKELQKTESEIKKIINYKFNKSIKKTSRSSFKIKRRDIK